MRIGKKMLAALLAIAMMVSLLPLPAFALEEDNSWDVEEVAFDNDPAESEEEEAIEVEAEEETVESVSEASTPRNMNKGTEIAEAVSDSSEDEIIASGECGSDGANVTWTLTSGGVLTINGTGAMVDYNGDGSPWTNHHVTSAIRPVRKPCKG